jgi:hypothetical protein
VSKDCGFPRLQAGSVRGAFLHPTTIFVVWRPDNESEANIAVEVLLAGPFKVTDALLGPENFGGGLFHYLYDEAGS